MQLNSNVKRSLLLLGFSGFIAGILWSVNSGDAKAVKEHVAVGVPESVLVEEETKDPLWMKYMPKTSVEKRDAIRTSRQNELASMIEELNSVRKASVVLSDDVKQGIGQPHRQMSACVMVEPLVGPLTVATLKAIRTIVSDATSGLDATQVNVINSTLGVVSVGVPSWKSPILSAQEIRKNVTDAIGLAVAAVSVTIQRDNSITEFIPWIDDGKPIVRVSLPQFWMDKRSRQLGSEEVVLSTINNIVYEVAPQAVVEIAVVKGLPKAATGVQTTESYAKQFVLLGGLIAMLISGIATDCRRRKEEIIRVQAARTPSQEAASILQMEYAHAKRAIDSLEGARKIEVLRAIVSSEDAAQELPVIEVAKGKQLQLTKCG